MKLVLVTGMAIAAIVIGLAVLMMTKSTKPISIWERNAHEVGAAINNKIMAVAAETPQVHAIHNVNIPYADSTVPLRIYTPNDSQNNPIILMIHGGAWVGGSLDTHDNMARYLCRGAQAVVVSVGYTNSPEGKYPLPLLQCYAAIEWAVKHAQEYKADSMRLALVGDSAGGNIAAALCLMARDKKGPIITLQVLINPAPDLTGKGTLTKQNDAEDIMRWQALQYVERPEQVYEPYVSPIVAQDLTGLPPALIILAEKDALRVDGQKYADRLKAAGVQTTVYIQLGADHLAGNGARASKYAQESLDVAVEALRNVFHNPSF